MDAMIQNHKKEEQSMNKEKLPSGSYRVRKTVNGKTYTEIFDHKPTDAEVTIRLSEKIGSDDVLNHGTALTFKIASDKYIAARSNILSPSTIREYTRIPTRLSPDFIKKPIDKITKKDIENEVNLLASKLAPKTVKGYANYIFTIMRDNRPKMDISVRLPQQIDKDPYIPTKEEVQKLIEDSKTESKGMYYVPIMLAVYGFRRSEIMGLKPEDIDENRVVHIHNAVVQDVNKNWVEKTTKTEKSAREFPLPEDVVNKIREQGYVYNGGAQSISNYIARWCNKNNVEHFSIHKLRHYFATTLFANGADGETAKYMGGWASDYVLNKHYKHKVEEKVKKQSDVLKSILLG